MPILQYDKNNDRYHLTIPKEIIELDDLLRGTKIYFCREGDGRIVLKWKPRDEAKK